MVISGEIGSKSEPNVWLLICASETVNDRASAYPPFGTVSVKPSSESPGIETLIVPPVGVTVCCATCRVGPVIRLPLPDGEEFVGWLRYWQAVKENAIARMRTRKDRKSVNITHLQRDK